MPIVKGDGAPFLLILNRSVLAGGLHLGRVHRLHVRREWDYKVPCRHGGDTKNEPIFSSVFAICCIAALSRTAHDVES